MMLMANVLDIMKFLEIVAIGARMSWIQLTSATLYHLQSVGSL